MKAVRYSKYGGPEVVNVVEEEQPMPKNNEYRIKIMATTVTPTDCAMRKADPFITRFFAGFLRPKDIPGDSIAGVIDAVGSDITSFKVGDEVYGTSAPKTGAHAEYICLDEESPIVLKPKKLTFDEAAGISDGAITALPFLRDVAKLSKGQSILINGGSGAIGTYAIQLAKHYGAMVTAVCSGGNRQLVKDLGADYFIDYTKDDLSRITTKYDVFFDAVGKSSFKKTKSLLKEYGLYMTTVPSFSVMVQSVVTSRRKGKAATFAATGLRKGPDKKKDFDFLSGLFNEKKLVTYIDRVYDLEHIREAHSYVEQGHKKGNVLVRLVD